MHPLKRLLGHAAERRGDVRLATVWSILNKVFDVLPEILIGVAVDVVVNRQDSFLARLGVPDPVDQLVLLTGLTILVWVLESLTEYLAAVKWRNLAQHLQHRLRLDGYGHLQRLDPGQLERQRSGRLMAVLNEDVNQIERFLNPDRHRLARHGQGLDPLCRAPHLTMRMSHRRFTSLTNAHSMKVENHAYAIALHFMHYNFRRTQMRCA